MSFFVNSANSSKSNLPNNFTQLEIPIVGNEKLLSSIILQQLKGTQKWDERFEYWLASLFAKIASAADAQSSEEIELRMLEILHLLEFSNIDATSSSKPLSHERIQMALHSLVKNLGQVNSAIVLSRCYQLAHSFSKFVHLQAQTLKELFHRLISSFEQKYQYYVKEEHVHKELELATLPPSLNVDLNVRVQQKEKIKKTALVVLGLIGTASLLAFYQIYSTRSPIESNPQGLREGYQSPGENSTVKATNSQRLVENHDITVYSQANPFSQILDNLPETLPKNVQEVPQIKETPIASTVDNARPIIDEAPLASTDVPKEEVVSENEMTQTVDKILNTVSTFLNSKRAVEPVETNDSEEPIDLSISPHAKTVVTPISNGDPIVPPITPDPSTAKPSTQPKKQIPLASADEILELKKCTLRKTHTDPRCEELLRNNIEAIIPIDPIEIPEGYDAFVSFIHSFNSYLHDLSIEDYFKLSLQDIGRHIADEKLLKLLPGSFLTKLWPHLNTEALSQLKLEPKRIKSIDPERIVLNTGIFEHAELVKALTPEQLKAFYVSNADFSDEHFTPEQKVYIEQLKTTS